MNNINNDNNVHLVWIIYCLKRKKNTTFNSLASHQA